MNRIDRLIQKAHKLTGDDVETEDFLDIELIIYGVEDCLRRHDEKEHAEILARAKLLENETELGIPD